MSEAPASLGDLLRRLRSAASLSQEELAERSGLSRRGISDLERGARHAPRLETVRLLADALGLGEADAGRVTRRGTTGPPGTSPARTRRPSSTPSGSADPADRARDGVAALPAGLRDADVRLLTLTGPGGRARPGWRSRSRPRCGRFPRRGGLRRSLAAHRSDARGADDRRRARRAGGRRQPLLETLATFLAPSGCCSSSTTANGCSPPRPTSPRSWRPVPA